MMTSGLLPAAVTVLSKEVSPEAGPKNFLDLDIKMTINCFFC